MRLTSLEGERYPGQGRGRTLPRADAAERVFKTKYVLELNALEFLFLRQSMRYRTGAAPAQAVRSADRVTGASFREVSAGWTILGSTVHISHWHRPRPGRALCRS